MRIGCTKRKQKGYLPTGRIEGLNAIKSESNQLFPVTKDHRTQYKYRNWYTHKCHKNMGTTNYSKYYRIFKTKISSSTHTHSLTKPKHFNNCNYKSLISKLDHKTGVNSQFFFASKGSLFPSKFAALSIHSQIIAYHR